VELCQVITVTEADYFDAPTSKLINRILFPGVPMLDLEHHAPETPDKIKMVTPKKILISTGKKFSYVQACINHMQDPSSGNKYGGRRWMLVGARGKNHEFALEEKPQYTTPL